LSQQKRALEQCLDENTPLGKVAHMQRSGTLRAPDITRGFLNQVTTLLEKVYQELGYVDIQSVVFEEGEKIERPKGP
jgi:hypothetical protein